MVDFNRLKNNFGREGGNLAGDLNYDEAVDLLDFSILKENFGVDAEAPQDEVASSETNAAVAAAAIFAALEGDSDD
ncbi:MAG: hypothetical protein KDA61_23370 [Planctomycetales bacterium]|nr:hypothetical protein [Planctomycetales bacterium]